MFFDDEAAETLARYASTPLAVLGLAANMAVSAFLASENRRRVTRADAEAVLEMAGRAVWKALPDVGIRTDAQAAAELRKRGVRVSRSNVTEIRNGTRGGARADAVLAALHQIVSERGVQPIDAAAAAKEAAG